MYDGIKVNRPAYPKDLRHEDLLRILVPEGSAYSFDCREAKVIWNTGNLAVPGSILGGPANLINYGYPDEREKKRAPNYILRPEDLFPVHTLFPFPIQFTTRLTLKTFFLLPYFFCRLEHIIAVTQYPHKIQKEYHKWFTGSISG
jgi:hypothetical protein